MSSNQQQSGESSSMDLMWMIIFLVASLVAIWYFGHVYIIRFILSIKSIELSFIEFFTGNLDALRAQINAYYTSAETTTLTQVNDISVQIGQYLVFPIVGILIVLGAYLYFKHPALKFNITFNMKKLFNTEKQYWPQIIPISKAKLDEIPLLEGPWSMALSPMEFAKKYDILKPPDKSKRRRRQIRLATIDIDRARTTFIKQLGPPWQGVERLPIHIQALFGTFAARAKEDREDARRLLNQISRSAESGKLDFTGATQLALRYKEDELIKLVVNNHAYVTTVMATMLELGRTDGVLATADFLWLKPVDRVMWYLLNSVGRQTAPAEVAGPFAHWLAERELQRKMEQPIIEQATEALALALKDIIYRPDDELINPLE